MEVFSRGALVQEVLEAADARGSNRWTPTTILSVLDTVFHDEWTTILTANPFYRVRRHVVGMAPGFIDLAALDFGTGDDTERLFRVIGIRQGATIYRPSALPSYLAEEAPGTGWGYEPASFYQEGSRLYLRPSVTGDVEVVANHTPQSPSKLANDDSLIRFPARRQLILAYEAAAHLLAKGGLETDSAAALKALAAEQRTRMLADLARVHIDPGHVATFGSAAEWGG